MNPNIQTSLTYREIGPDKQTFNGKSLTQPDEVLTIRQMLVNHVRGLPQHVNTGQYYDEELGYVPHPSELDLVERADFAEYYAQTVERLRQQSSPKPQSDEGATPPPEGGKPTSPTSQGASAKPDANASE